MEEEEAEEGRREEVKKVAVARGVWMMLLGVGSAEKGNAVLGGIVSW